MMSKKATILLLIAICAVSNIESRTSFVSRKSGFTQGRVARQSYTPRFHPKQVRRQSGREMWSFGGIFKAVARGVTYVVSKAKMVYNKVNSVINVAKPYIAQAKDLYHQASGVVNSAVELSKNAYKDAKGIYNGTTPPAEQPAEQAQARMLIRAYHSRLLRRTKGTKINFNDIISRATPNNAVRAIEIENRMMIRRLRRFQRGFRELEDVERANFMSNLLVKTYTNAQKFTHNKCQTLTEEYKSGRLLFFSHLKAARQLASTPRVKIYEVYSDDEEDRDRRAQQFEQSEEAHFQRMMARVEKYPTIANAKAQAAEGDEGAKKMLVMLSASAYCELETFYKQSASTWQLIADRSKQGIDQLNQKMDEDEANGNDEDEEGDEDEASPATKGTFNNRLAKLHEDLAHAYALADKNPSVQPLIDELERKIKNLRK